MSIRTDNHLPQFCHRPGGRAKHSLGYDRAQRRVLLKYIEWGSYLRLLENWLLYGLALKVCV